MKVLICSFKSGLLPKISFILFISTNKLFSMFLILFINIRKNQIVIIHH
jgi:hypothetical protein